MSRVPLPSMTAIQYRPIGRAGDRTGEAVAISSGLVPPVRRPMRRARILLCAVLAAGSLVALPGDDPHGRTSAPDAQAWPDVHAAAAAPAAAPAAGTGPAWTAAPVAWPAAASGVLDLAAPPRVVTPGRPLDDR